MNVLFVAAEVAPHIKTGGLADVAGALPAALRDAGHDVRVVMPYYRQLREQGLPVDGPVAASFLTVLERNEELRVWTIRDSAVPIYLLDIPAAFERGSIYGDGDDDRRFILFARGVLALMQHLREVAGWQPDVVHAHDWHAALVPNYIRTTHEYTFGHIATVFTIHNLAYQGQVRPEAINMAGLSERGLVENAMGPGIANTFNFMGRGLVYSDVVTTVSPTYAQEIMTPEYGERLDAVMRSRRDRVTGILNGIDGVAFDPATDRALAATYDADSPSAKATCKAALQREVGLAVAPRAPLLGIVSRLVEQKGLDLLHAIIPTLMARTDAQLVLLGSGAPYLQDAMRGHAAANPGRVAVRLGFDAALAQRIYAGSDMFLMPSRFEPCGLGQMIALRYGSVPIVRATGGLNDTVREGWEGNGFVFHQYEARHFMDAIDRALAAYADAKSWTMLRTRGMREDNSWTNAAERYVGVYRWALQLRGRSA
ncbi:MAG: glycogen synthase GlgA [Gemmatimonadaceae bacterium]|nr:glycogen synthase GlgA [Gemmatimonadaceae bacterium]